MFLIFAHNMHLVLFVTPIDVYFGVLELVNAITREQVHLRTPDLHIRTPDLHIICFYHGFQHILKMGCVDLHFYTRLANFRSFFGVFRCVNAITHMFLHSFQNLHGIY